MRGELEVQHEGTKINIHGSDECQIVIREKNFLMHEAPLITPDLYARFAHQRIKCEGRQPGQQVVGLLRQNDAHINSAEGSMT